MVCACSSHAFWALLSATAHMHTQVVDILMNYVATVRFPAVK